MISTFIIVTFKSSEQFEKKKTVLLKLHYIHNLHQSLILNQGRI